MSRRRRRLEAKNRREDLEVRLYQPAESSEELQQLAWKVTKQRTDFYTHLGSWGATSLFLFVVNMVTTMFESGEELPGRVWFLFPMLAWGIGLAGHAASAFWAHPRALAAQRRLLARRGLPTSSSAAEDPMAFGAELDTMAHRIRAHLQDLQPPRLDLEASLDVAQEQARELGQQLLQLDATLRRLAHRQASPERMEALTTERERLQATLEGYRLTLTNIEVDALLLAGSGDRTGPALEMLKDEADLLRAAADGVRRATPR